MAVQEGPECRADDGAGGRATGAAGAGWRRLRRFVAAAVSAPTGPELLAALTAVTGRHDLSARELAEVARGWKRMRSFCDAAQLTVVADLATAMEPGTDAAARPGRTDPLRPAADELAPVLGIAPRAASRLVALARRCGDMPAALDALAEGRMDLTQLTILDHTARDLPVRAATALEAAAVAWAPQTTAQRLRADLATEAQRLDPGHAAAAAARGVADRDVTWRPSPTPGCGRLVHDSPLIPGTAAWLALNTAAKNAKKAGVRPDGTTEDRTLAQLRSDIHTALLTGSGDPLGGHVPTPAELARMADLHVVVAADTLAGTAPTCVPPIGTPPGGMPLRIPPTGTPPGPGRPGDLPAHIPGVGPVDVRTVRHLAPDTGWRRLVVDPCTGVLLHVDDQVLAPPTSDAAPDVTGEPRSVVTDPRWQDLVAAPIVDPRLTSGGYRAPDRLRRHVQTRDATCVGPACFHPAEGGQLDHTINFGQRAPDGTLGTTSAGDLGSLCERIHNAKTHGGWQLRQPAPGFFVWTSPTGRTYLRTARPQVPGWRHRTQPRERPPPADGDL